MALATQKPTSKGKGTCKRWPNEKNGFFGNKIELSNQTFIQSHQFWLSNSNTTSGIN
jgi:hypothetical protein